MKFQIEDYSGNEVTTIAIPQLVGETKSTDIKVVEGISKMYGFNVADIDEDDNGVEVIRLQREEEDELEGDLRNGVVYLVASLVNKYAKM